jgi:long-chain acyl-CoA synthetase
MLAVPRLCTALWDSVQAAVQARGLAAATAFRLLLAASVAVRRATGLHIGRWLFHAVHERLGASLTLIGCGGAKLPADLTWKLEGLGFTVLTGYGLTETSPVLTFNSRSHSRLGSEGRALPGVELRIAAAPGQTQGEIQARGPSVFAGYWNNPAANATAFTADGWFQTGDLGRIDADGYLYVVGRNKELIVLPDGKKLFPETVEKLYAASPLLREIAIFERDGVLAALIVPDEQAVLERGALREAALLREELEDIAARLAPYQRLGAYRITRAPLPRTQLGKLKRHLLPALFDEADQAPATPPAAATSAADRELLDSERAGAAWRWLEQRYPERPLTLDTSPQLDLQIDSLEWVTLTIEIQRRFGVVLTGEALSRILTLRDLLREITTAAPATAQAATPTPAFAPPGPLLRALGAAIYAVLRLVVRVAWRLEVTGTAELPERGPLLITPNHCSYLDPPALAAALPWRQLRKTYWAGWVGVMYTNPLRRLLSRATQVFPIDPDRDLAGAVRTAQGLLQRGYSVVWFPEGRRSPSGELQAFQAGVGVLLQAGAVTVVPTAIRGTFAAWPKRRWPQLGHSACGSAHR